MLECQITRYFKSIKPFSTSFTLKIAIILNILQFDFPISEGVLFNRQADQKALRIVKYVIRIQIVFFQNPFCNSLKIQNFKIRV